MYLECIPRSDGLAYVKENPKGEAYKSRKRGRLRIRWLDDVLEDLRRIYVRGYTESAMDMRQ